MSTNEFKLNEINSGKLKGARSSEREVGSRQPSRAATSPPASDAPASASARSDHFTGASELVADVGWAKRELDRIARELATLPAWVKSAAQAGHEPDEPCCGEFRQGGNYTRPVPYSHPMEYQALIAHKIVGTFFTHQEAESRIREEFQDCELIHIDARTEI